MELSAPRVAVLLAALVAAITPASAVAQRDVPDCASAPDAAAIDQYCEMIPGTSQSPTSADGLRLEQTLPPEDVEALRAAGVAGAALLKLPLISPPRGPGGRPGALSGAERVLEAAGIGPGRPPPGAPDAFAALTRSLGGDGVGAALRWGLAISTLSLLGATWMRIRAPLGR
jgi:hypothetical protein